MRITMAIFLALGGPAMAAEVQVPRWQPYDFAFSCSAPQANPFQVAFSADLVGPQGIKLRMPGFYDGNGTWDLSKEANNEKDLQYKLNRLRFVRQNDPYHRLLTVHDDRATYDRGAYDDLIDYRSDQQHSDWRKTTLEHLQKNRWPVVNVESGYEHGPGGLQDKTYGVAQSPEEVCRRAWEIVLAGGYAAYYYTYTAWDVIRPQDTPPGYDYFNHLRQFFETTAYWRMQPVEGLASDGYCLAEPGREYVVFLNNARPFTLKLQGVRGTLRTEWVQPYTGKRQAAAGVTNGTPVLKPPLDWDEGPVALHVGPDH